jgi:hypothetical protein
MKNQYFGDRNDYRKYGLLRALAEASGLRLGVCWMMTTDDGSTDGKFRDYLSQPATWRSFDPTLYDGLREIAGVRSVEAIEATALLDGARFVKTIVPDHAARRREWFAEAIATLAECSLIFSDPDNGIEVRSCPPGHRKSSKFVAWRELEEAARRGHSLVIYQHFPRRERRSFHRRAREHSRVANRRNRLRVRHAIRRLLRRGSACSRVCARGGDAAHSRAMAGRAAADCVWRLTSCAKVPAPLPAFRRGTNQ